ncbi:hypothetical protein BDQ17DRAFT_1366149 [Cyathus striatus]|nr:hypothetical protein BDQ17DRAFT_1366149 [Cyathus striatus]
MVGRRYHLSEIGSDYSYFDINYDMKPSTIQRPVNWWFEKNLMPNQKATVMFRKRR